MYTIVTSVTTHQHEKLNFPSERVFTFKNYML